MDLISDLVGRGVSLARSLDVFLGSLRRAQITAEMPFKTAMMAHPEAVIRAAMPRNSSMHRWLSSLFQVAEVGI
jgi:hypothetical protein